MKSYPNVYIAVYNALFVGEYGIEISGYSERSSRCVIYATSDDYSGCYMTNLTVPDKYCKVTDGKVVLEKHVIIGTRTSIMPNVSIGEGTAVGSMFLVTKSSKAWGDIRRDTLQKTQGMKKGLTCFRKRVYRG